MRRRADTTDAVADGTPRRGGDRPRLPVVPPILSASDVASTVAAIAGAQEASGVIPWYPGGDADPWDHVECAMALSAAGEWDAAQRAYAWLRATQRGDGSWPMRTRQNAVVDAAADTNQCAYVATGTWHHTLVTGDRGFAKWMWPTVRAAVDFVLALQRRSGAIAWARDARGAAASEALLAGCSSIHHSLHCAVALAGVVGEAQPDWELAAQDLAEAIADRPEVFADRERYSMDWYYPILGGAVGGDAATSRLARSWDTFVVPGLGIRCVADRPWVTGAETCELALALDAVGEPDRAAELLADMQHLRDSDGAYWTGYVFDDGARWPVERSTWTAAAVILAADVLARASPGAGIFRSMAPDARDVRGTDGGAAVAAAGGSSDAVADALEQT